MLLNKVKVSTDIGQSKRALTAGDFTKADDSTEFSIALQRTATVSMASWFLWLFNMQAILMLYRIVIKFSYFIHSLDVDVDLQILFEKLQIEK